MPAGKHERQSVGGKARAEKLSPERKSQIARAAAAARWKKDRSPTRRITVTLSDDDLSAIEALRASIAAPSVGAVIRKLIREAHKRMDTGGKEKLK